MCKLCGSVAPNGSTATCHLCSRMKAWFCSARTHSRMKLPSPRTAVRGLAPECQFVIRLWPFSAAGGGVVSGVLAIRPRPGQLLVVWRLEQTAGVAGGPADDLGRLAVLLAALLPAGRPALVGQRGLPLGLVPEEHLSVAVAADAEGHGREGRSAELGCAQ